MAGFPDFYKDPADTNVPCTIDWSAKLPTGRKIVSTAIGINGDATVTDATVYGAGVTALSLKVSGGSSAGYTGDPVIGFLTVVTLTVTLDDGSIMSRTFRVIGKINAGIT